MTIHSVNNTPTNISHRPHNHLTLKTPEDVDGRLLKKDLGENSRGKTSSNWPYGGEGESK